MEQYLGDGRLRNGNKWRVARMETYWKTVEKVRKGRNRFLWNKAGGEGRWFEEISESERMWSRRLRVHGGLKTRSGILNWTYI